MQLVANSVAVPGTNDTGEWIEAVDLKAGDRLLNADQSWSEVISVKVEKKALKAYNLHVDQFYTFYVRGVDNDNVPAVWVHNACPIMAKDKAGKFTDQVFANKQSIARSDIANLRSRFLGNNAVKVGPGKWGNAAGTRQFRVKPDDYFGRHGSGPHVHLEFIVPNNAGTKFKVMKNVHIPLR